MFNQIAWPQSRGIRERRGKLAFRISRSFKGWKEKWNLILKKTHWPDVHRVNPPAALRTLSVLNTTERVEWSVVREDPRGPPASSCRFCLPPFDLLTSREEGEDTRRCPWTKCTCSGPSSWSHCCACSWRCAWTWWRCWAPPGWPPTTSPCRCGSRVPSPRLAGRDRSHRRLPGAASPRSRPVGLSTPHRRPSRLFCF